MVKFAIGRAIAASSASRRKGCRGGGRVVEMHARRLGGDACGGVVLSESRDKLKQ